MPVPRPIDLFHRPELTGNAISGVKLPEQRAFCISELPPSRHVTKTDRDALPSGAEGTHPHSGFASYLSMMPMVAEDSRKACGRTAQGQLCGTFVLNAPEMCSFANFAASRPNSVKNTPSFFALCCGCGVALLWRPVALPRGQLRLAHASTRKARALAGSMDLVESKGHPLLIAPYWLTFCLLCCFALCVWLGCFISLKWGKAINLLLSR